MQERDTYWMDRIDYTESGGDRMEIAQQRKLQLETLYEIVDELNYYEILGLSRLAHQSEIEPAFRAKTQQFHPSVLQGSGLEQDAELMVAAAIKDINIRYELEECLDMPEQSYNTIKTQLSDTMMQAYKELAEDNVLWTGEATINAVHAGALTKKLLQLCTGAVYNEDGDVVGFHKERYNLVMDLVAQRKHSLVAFNWTHERDYLIEQAEKRGIKYGVIDGGISAKVRKDVVDRMQAGQLQVVFAHPQSAGHGLTMTTATSVIWCSPTYNAEHYQQFNRRIYRAGQTKRTQVIHIAAENTWETDVYVKLSGKLGRMENLLTILKSLNSMKEQAA